MAPDVHRNRSAASHGGCGPVPVGVETTEACVPDRPARWGIRQCRGRPHHVQGGGRCKAGAALPDARRCAYRAGGSPICRPVWRPLRRAWRIDVVRHLSDPFCFPGASAFRRHPSREAVVKAAGLEGGCPGCHAGCTGMMAITGEGLAVRSHPCRCVTGRGARLRFPRSTGAQDLSGPALEIPPVVIMSDYGGRPFRCSSCPFPVAT